MISSVAVLLLNLFRKKYQEPYMKTTDYYSDMSGNRIIGIMAAYILFLLPLFMTNSCSHESCGRRVKPESKYERADVYYLTRPEWGVFYFAFPTLSLYFDGSGATDMLEKTTQKYVIGNRDTLNYILSRISSAEKTPSSYNRYICPRVMVLLYDYDSVTIDTLSTNTYPESSLQFNSSEFYDSGLAVFLTEMVLRRSPEWRSVLEYAPEFYREKYIPEEYRMRK